MSARPRVLLLKGHAKSFDSLMDRLADAADADSVATLVAFQKLIESKSYQAILCTSSFHGGTYRDLLALAQEQRWDIPVIVCAGEDGDREWVEALERGAFDLLVAPFQKATVARVLSEAIESREVGWEARPLAPRRRHSA